MRHWLHLELVALIGPTFLGVAGCSARSPPGAGCDPGHADTGGVAPFGWIDVSVGGQFACARWGDGTVVCWGNDDWGQQIKGIFDDITSGYAFTCGIEPGSGAIHCVGAEVSHVLSPPEGAFVAVEAGGSHHACALDVAGRATCWGDDYAGETRAPQDVVFSKLAPGHSRGARSRSSMPSRSAIRTCQVSDTP